MRLVLHRPGGVEDAHRHGSKRDLHAGVSTQVLDEALQLVAIVGGGGILPRRVWITVGLKGFTLWATAGFEERETHGLIRAKKKVGLVKASVELAVQPEHTAKLELAVRLLEPSQREEHTVGYKALRYVVILRPGQLTLMIVILREGTASAMRSPKLTSGPNVQPLLPLAISPSVEAPGSMRGS